MGRVVAYTYSTLTFMSCPSSSGQQLIEIGTLIVEG